MSEGNLYFIFDLVGGLSFLLSKQVLLSSIPVCQAHLHEHGKAVVGDGKAVVSELPWE